MGDFESNRLELFRRNGFVGAGRKITDAKGRDTYLIEGGKGDPPTVLIHGGISEASEWFLLGGLLDGRRVLPDRPGCGLSYPIDYRGLNYREAAADWVLHVVESLGTEQVNLVANSMGGYFAMCFALSHPELVRRLVFVGAPAGLDRYIPLPLRLWGNPILGPLFGVLVSGTRSPETVRKNVFPMLVAHPERLPTEFLELALTARTLPGAAAAAHTMLRTVLTLRGWRTEMMMRDELASLDLPTLFLWGDKDAFAPPSSGQDMVRRMPNADAEVISDAGHLPYVDQPEATQAAIGRFLS